MDAATLVRDARRRAGLTQAELAARAGISQPVVAAYERGRRDPTVGMLDKLLRAAGFEVDARLVPARTLPDAERVARELRQVLDLADALPHHPKRELAYPRLARR
jgi:transcriptional regulator with XRE-family HTH domain